MPDNTGDDTQSSSAAAEYGPPDEPMTYDETGDEAGRGRMVLLLAVVFVVAAAALLYVVFQQGVRTGGRNAPPVIVAESGPEKIRPEDPGGLDVPHQDKTVYDRVSGQSSERVERLLPEPEEPVDVSGLRTNDEAPAQADEEPAQDEPKQDEVAKTETPTDKAAQDEPVRELPKPRPAEPAPVEQTPIEQSETSGAEVINEVENIGDLIKSIPEDKPDLALDPIGNSVAEVDAASVNRASGTIPSATSGAYVVQVASFKGADLATGGWETLVRKNKDLLANLRPDIQLADLGNRGIYYRLRIGPFATKADAQSLCNALKARRQDCLVRAT